jgi:hypothetical protein
MQLFHSHKHIFSASFLATLNLPVWSGGCLPTVSNSSPLFSLIWFWLQLYMDSGWLHAEVTWQHPSSLASIMYVSHVWASILTMPWGVDEQPSITKELIPYELNHWSVEDWNHWINFPVYRDSWGAVPQTQQSFILDGGQLNNTVWMALPPSLSNSPCGSFLPCGIALTNSPMMSLKLGSLREPGT